MPGGNPSNLRPWKPGQSGNPLGRPRGTISLTRMIRERLKDRQLCGQDTPDGRTNAEWFVDRMIALAMKGNAAYMKEIMDRNDGPIPKEESTGELTMETLAEMEANDAELDRETDSQAPPGQVP